MSDAALIPREAWARDPEHWRGRFEGASIGTGISVLFFSSDEIGAGPPLHVHPYDEVFILRQGCARFVVGQQVLEAEAGQIVFAPAGVPHRFENLGPGRLETTDIHLSGKVIQTNVESPLPTTR